MEWRLETRAVQRFTAVLTASSDRRSRPILTLLLDKVGQPLVRPRSGAGRTGIWQAAGAETLPRITTRCVTNGSFIMMRLASLAASVAFLLTASASLAACSMSAGVALKLP